MNRKKTIYESPIVELLLIRVEKGFAGSILTNSTGENLGDGGTLNGEMLFT